MNESAMPPDCLLLIAPGCPHCPGMLESLGILVKEGAIGRLEVVNIALHPEPARQVGTRSVPWVRIGTFEFDGLLSLGELREWAGSAAQDSGWSSYLSHLLEHRQLDKALGLIRRTPSLIHDLIRLLASLEVPMAVRIGVGAVIEELEGDAVLEQGADDLVALTRADEPQIRADACHYLGFARTARAEAALNASLQDEDAEVREIAAESLALFR